jgi:divalent metal cation (Fe/Co/Zn/Cd) transporter
MVETFGAAILPADAGTTLVTSVAGMVTDNLPIILPLIAFGIGFSIVRKFVNRAHKGKV